jgi:hypothetical protein
LPHVIYFIKKNLKKYNNLKIKERLKILYFFLKKKKTEGVAQTPPLAQMGVATRATTSNFVFFFP